MKKNKKGKKPEVVAAAKPAQGDTPNPSTEPTVPDVSEAGDSFGVSSSTKPQEIRLPAGHVRRLLPDVLKVTGACIVVVMALLILLNPPLVQSARPNVSYSYHGMTYTNAVLYRPLAMPNRYYIALPEKLEGRYQFFAVDRRREVATLMTNSLSRSFLGLPVIKRSDPMGLDLEFRHLDDSEWKVFFLPEAILFSNAVLAVRLDVK